ncbi:MAG: Rpn family recombination-promoting nuclease/putative transposase [Deltaproteobacteria bacterium]|nr:Rpn family recombination-promoting nuclease/putative transposase [Deltaproteobacteria bacterium]
MKLLDPKLDVVFKMLFAEPRNEGLLKSLLAAVLRPPSPIAHVTVIDPELPKELVEDRGVRLDVLVELEGGKLVDVEMQCDPRGGHGARWLYHWARLYSSRLRRGDGYDDLEPVVCVVFLDARTPANRFHATYEVREVHDHRPLSDVLAVHVVQLPRLERAAAEGERVELQRWARFLRLSGGDERALDSLASESPIMAEAKYALEVLSREPSARRIAELRREAEIARRLDRAEDLAQGRAEGRDLGRAEGRDLGRAEGHELGLAEGRERGRADATRAHIESFCRASGIELDDERRSALDALDEVGLATLLDALFARRAWP